MKKTVETALELPQTGFVRLPTILALYPVSKSTWLSGIKSGRFPVGVKLSENTRAWSVDCIRKLIEDVSENGEVLAVKCNSNRSGNFNTYGIHVKGVSDKGGAAETGDSVA